MTAITTTTKNRIDLNLIENASQEVREAEDKLKYLQGSIDTLRAQLKPLVGEQALLIRKIYNLNNFIKSFDKE